MAGEVYEHNVWLAPEHHIHGGPRLGMWLPVQLDGETINFGLRVGSIPAFCEVPKEGVMARMKLVVLAPSQVKPFSSGRTK